MGRFNTKVKTFSQKVLSFQHLKTILKFFSDCKSPLLSTSPWNGATLWNGCLGLHCKVNVTQIGKAAFLLNQSYKRPVASLSSMLTAVVGCIKHHSKPVKHGKYLLQNQVLIPLCLQVFFYCQLTSYLGLLLSLKLVLMHICKNVFCFSYANLISLAINSSPKKKMTLSEIYLWICDKFPFYREANSGWKVSLFKDMSG